MDSMIEYNPGQRDASDPEIELHAHAQQTDAGQLLAQNSDSAAEGLQTDADARQAADSNVGRWPVGLSPRSDPVTHQRPRPAQPLKPVPRGADKQHIRRRNQQQQTRTMVRIPRCPEPRLLTRVCLLYTSDAADE